jgi:antitoxin PrlF
MESSVQSTITKKGQATIPRAIRDHLGVKPGDRIKFFILRNRTVVITPTVPVAALKGIVQAPPQPVSIEDMNDAPAAAAVERDLRSRKK